MDVYAKNKFYILKWNPFYHKHLKMKKLSLICIALFAMNCINAQKAALAKTYHDNGKLASIGKQYPAKELKFANKQIDDIYKNSSWMQLEPRKVGEWKWYHENGQLKTIGFYTEEKKSDGEIYTFEDKEWTNFFQNGNLESIGSYKRGSKDGIWKKYWNEADKIYNIGSYLKNSKEGQWKQYYISGKLVTVGNYEKDKQTGTWKQYYETGELEVVSEYLKGSKNGSQKFYHKNGKLSFLRTFSNGLRVGEAKWFHENGKLATVGNYSNDLQVGEWKRYDENGGVSNTEMFYNINKDASLKDIELRAVSAFKGSSTKETRVDLKFKTSNIGATIYPPGSRSAFYLKDEKGNRYELTGQEDWPGAGANGFGRTNKSVKNLMISLKFENVPLDEVKKLDLMEGDLSGSKGWHFYDILSQNKTITYASDECISGDCKNSTGVFKWSNGDKYEGTFEDGKKEGKGVFYFANGDKYEGEFKSDKMHGSGIIILKNSEKFNGRYNYGRMEYGTYSYKNGDTYNGYFSDEKPNESGRYTFANGSKYDGQFKNGKYEGYGTFTGNDEDMFVGLWQSGLKHGEGIHYLSNGDIYIGRYENDKRKEGKTYTTAVEKNKIVDKYKNGSIRNNYSKNEKKEKKKQSFEKIVALMKKAANTHDEKWHIESVDYKAYKIVFSEIVSGGMFGINYKNKNHYFLDLNDLSSLGIKAWESDKIQASLYFENKIKRRVDDLETGKKGKVGEGLLYSSSFDFYFRDDVLSAIELENEIEKFKTL